MNERMNQEDRNGCCVIAAAAVAAAAAAAEAKKSKEEQCRRGRRERVGSRRTSDGIGGIRHCFAIAPPPLPPPGWDGATYTLHATRYTTSADGDQQRAELVNVWARLVTASLWRYNNNTPNAKSNQLFFPSTTTTKKNTLQFLYKEENKYKYVRFSMIVMAILKGRFTIGEKVVFLIPSSLSPSSCSRGQKQERHFQTLYNENAGRCRKSSPFLNPSGNGASFF